MVTGIDLDALGQPQLLETLRRFATGTP